MSFKLIVETPADNNEFEYIVEEKNANEPRNFYIKGPYMMAEGANRNKRIYSLHEMQTEVTRYTNEMIKTGRAMGELNHPTTADVDLGRACHLVTEFTQEGNQLDGIFVNRKPISDARANYSATLTFKTEYFRINKWYNVKYLVNEAGDFLFTNNIQYLPKGYDIIVIAGGSNQVGEDTDTTRGDSAPYTIDRERG